MAARSRLHTRGPANLGDKSAMPLYVLVAPGDSTLPQLHTMPPCPWSRDSLVRRPKPQFEITKYSGSRLSFTPSLPSWHIPLP